MRLLKSPPLNNTKIGLTIGCGLVGTIFVAPFMANRAPAQETRTETQIEPGLTLISCIRPLPDGPLRFWVVKADKTQGWKMGLEVAEPTDAIKKRNVRTIAERTGATVAVNGGFFAYGGAAVGAVKVNGSWQRMPWKKRTALAWDNNGVAAFGSLEGKVSISLGNIGLEDVTLNGLTRAYSFARENNFAVITPQFGKVVNLRPTMAAAIVRNGRVESTIIPQLAPVAPVPVPVPESPVPLPETAPPVTGNATVDTPPVQPIKITVPTDGWILVSLTPERNQDVLVAPGTAAKFGVSLAPSNWSRWPHILGAGPRLVQDGEVKTTEKEEEFRPDVLARGPRTAVGVDESGNWLFLVADGRQLNSIGLTLPETAALFKEFGANQAMNLDGGSSTQLVVNGTLTNTPSGYDPVNPLRQREVQVTNALVLRK